MNYTIEKNTHLLYLRNFTFVFKIDFCGFLYLAPSNFYLLIFLMHPVFISVRDFNFLFLWKTEKSVSTFPGFLTRKMSYFYPFIKAATSSSSRAPKPECRKWRNYRGNKSTKTAKPDEDRRYNFGTLIWALLFSALGPIPHTAADIKWPFKTSPVEFFAKEFLKLNFWNKFNAVKNIYCCHSHFLSVTNHNSLLHIQLMSVVSMNQIFMLSTGKDTFTTHY